MAIGHLTVSVGDNSALLYKFAVVETPAAPPPNQGGPEIHRGEPQTALGQPPTAPSQPTQSVQTANVAKEPPTVYEGVGPKLEVLEQYRKALYPFRYHRVTNGTDEIDVVAKDVEQTFFPETAGKIRSALRDWSKSSGAKAVHVSFQVNSQDAIALLDQPWEVLPEMLGLTGVPVTRSITWSPQDATDHAALSGSQPATAQNSPVQTIRVAPPGFRLPLDLAEANSQADLTVQLLNDDGSVDLTSLKELANRMRTAALVILNGSGTGVIGALQATEVEKHIAVVGWFGYVAAPAMDVLSTMVPAGKPDNPPLKPTLSWLRSINPDRVGELPIVYTSLPLVLEVPEPEAPRHLAGGNESTRNSTPPAVTPVRGPSVALNLPSFLTPAVLRSSAAPLRYARVSGVDTRGTAATILTVDCDAGIGKSSWSTPLPSKGNGRIDLTSARFPVLQELARKQVNRRHVTFTTRVVKDGETQHEQTASTVWLGHQEWIVNDSELPYLPAYVQPQSQAVLDIFDEACILLSKATSGPRSFVGYKVPCTDHVHAQVEAIFDAIKTRFPLKYIGPGSGVAQRTDSTLLVGQVVRTADEVLTHRRGTCIDLALLIAACLEYVRIHPMLVLLSGHTLVAYWTDQEAQLRFWDEQNEKQNFDGQMGSTWILQNHNDLKKLLGSGVLRCLDPTDVTRHECTFEQCRLQGSRQIQPATFKAGIDVISARADVWPM
ncbi:MAG: hypothetical protein IPK82_39670 [Polyangiaceae bacterium]|nr:hypothetical protein [Polyangiaceae bacterium]